MTENPKLPRPAKRRRRGVTLIEAVLYISIALALIVGGLVFYQQTVLASRVNSTARALAFVIAEVRTILTESTADIAATEQQTEALLLARGSVPVDFVDGSRPAGRRILNPWGGELTFSYRAARNPGTGVRNAQMTVYIKRIPVAVCMRIGASNEAGNNSWVTNMTSGRVRDDAGGGAVRPLFRGDTLDQAGAQCRAADSDGDGLVELESTLRSSD